MPIEASGLRGWPVPAPAKTMPAAGRFTIGYDRLVNAALAACVASGSIAFVEPSPYDVLLLGLMGLWFLGGFSLHRFVIPFAALLILYTLGGFLALLPYLNEPDPTTFMEQSVYLTLAAIFFALFFAQNTLPRIEICLKAFAVSTVVAATCGVAGYFNIAGTEGLFTLYGRASGTFKDPNVFGPYLILGALYYIQILILGRTRHVVATLAALLVVVAGIFLSFSRGAWGAFAVASLLTVVLAFLSTPHHRIRRRIIVMAVLAAAAAVLALMVLLSIDSVRELFLQRFALTQDYDTGATGRFGNQLRAIPMLMERLNGFGPVRFRLIFDLDSHNSYLGSFSSYGWLGGGCFFLLVGLTSFIGFRLVLARSPFQRVAQVVWPALFVILAQGIQIDIDHWRHLYLMFGAVWGLETARIKALQNGRALAPAHPADRRPQLAPA
jgi:hypothetical protein